MVNNHDDDDDMPNNVIWLEDPWKYHYLRISRDNTSTSRPPIKTTTKEYNKNRWKLVGYSKPVKERNGFYYWTLFWLKDYDRGMPNSDEVYGGDNMNFMPCEGQTVKTIMCKMMLKNLKDED